MENNTPKWPDGINVPSCVEISKFAVERLVEIQKIIESGKAVRFTMKRHRDGENLWKDVKDIRLDEMGDMKAFRVSGNALVDYVYWEYPLYSISAVEI